MSDQINAPFSAEQVDGLNQYQVGVQTVLCGHPFTCANRSERVGEANGHEVSAPHGVQGGDRGVLVATVAGWVCPHCSYTQNWAYASMACPGDQIDDQLEVTLQGGGDYAKAVMLARVDQVIAGYTALRDSQAVMPCSLATDRINNACASMLESMHRRRLVLVN